LKGPSRGIVLTMCHVMTDTGATLPSEVEYSALALLALASLNARFPGATSGVTRPTQKLLLGVTPCQTRRSVPVSICSRKSHDLMASSEPKAYRVIGWSLRFYRFLSPARLPFRHSRAGGDQYRKSARPLAAWACPVCPDTAPRLLSATLRSERSEPLRVVPRTGGDAPAAGRCRSIGTANRPSRHRQARGRFRIRPHGRRAPCRSGPHGLLRRRTAAVCHSSRCLRS